VRWAVAVLVGFVAGAAYMVRRAGRGAPRVEDYQVRPDWRPQPD